VDKGGRAPVKAWRLLTLDEPANPAPHLDAPMVGARPGTGRAPQTFERASPTAPASSSRSWARRESGKSRLAHEFASLSRNGQLPSEGTACRMGTASPSGRWPARSVKPRTCARTTQSRLRVRNCWPSSVPRNTPIRSPISFLPVLSLTETAASLEQIFWAVRRLLENHCQGSPADRRIR